MHEFPVRFDAKLGIVLFKVILYFVSCQITSKPPLRGICLVHFFQQSFQGRCWVMLKPINSKNSRFLGQWLKSKQPMVIVLVPHGLWGCGVGPLPNGQHLAHPNPSKSKRGILINGTSVGGDFFHFFLFSPAQKNGKMFTHFWLHVFFQMGWLKNHQEFADLLWRSPGASWNEKPDRGLEAPLGKKQCFFFSDVSFVTRHC